MKEKEFLKNQERKKKREIKILQDQLATFANEKKMESQETTAKSIEGANKAGKYLTWQLKKKRENKIIKS